MIAISPAYLLVLTVIAADPVQTGEDQTALPAVAAFCLEGVGQGRMGAGAMLAELVVLEEIDETGGFETATRREVIARLSPEQRRWFDNCLDVACALRIGKAVKARYVLTWAVDSADVVNVMAVDVEGETAVASKSGRLSGDREEKVAAIRAIAKEVVRSLVEAKAKPRIPSPASGTVVPPLSPDRAPAKPAAGAAALLPPQDSRPSSDERRLSNDAQKVERRHERPATNWYNVGGHVGFWTGITVLGTSPIWYKAAADAQQAYSNSLADASKHEDDFRRYYGLSIAGWTIGGTFLAAGITLWILDPGQDAVEAQCLSLGPMWGEGEAGVLVTGKW